MEAGGEALQWWPAVRVAGIGRKIQVRFGSKANRWRFRYSSRSDCSSTTISEVNNSRLLAMSLASAVRGLGVVEVSIVTHRLQAACFGRKL